MVSACDSLRLFQSSIVFKTKLFLMRSVLAVYKTFGGGGAGKNVLVGRAGIDPLTSDGMDPTPLLPIPRHAQ